MPVLQSLGQLTALETAVYPSGVYSSLLMYDQYAQAYSTIYRTQPNVRTCVDFLARNIAQLGLHVFRRVSDTDRERLTDHPLAVLLSWPLPAVYKTSRYQLIGALISDMGIYFNAYWLKVGDATGRMGLLRIPVPDVEVLGGITPTGYRVTIAGRQWTYTPDRVVHFRGYNPETPLVGLSPLETLRRVLAEEYAMGDYREHFWQNSARMAGVIERPIEAVEWSPAARERFKAEFEALYAGSDNSGKTAILEEGMTWKPGGFSAQESEYLAGRKLTREECARAYHIPLPMVGILDHATFSNIKEQHKNLYQDCLGPWLAMIEQEIELQLVPDFADAKGVYVEFNIAEKLQGSFEEQTQSLQSAVGRPWMTADEARARMNLPSMGGDAEELVTPLNVLVGGQASPRDSAPDGASVAPKGMPASKAKGERIDPTLPETRARHEAKWRQVLARFFTRQEQATLGKVPEKTANNLRLLAGGRKAGIDDVWDEGRWDVELEADILRLNVATATVWAKWLAELLKFELDEAIMLGWLKENAQIAAQNINRTTRAQILAALLDDAPREAVQHLFEIAREVRAGEIAVSRVTAASVFGSQEAARQGGLKTKTWQVNSSNPRPEHAALNGQTVGIGELFSNGMRWPGDPAGGADNLAGCTCSVTFGR